METVHKRIYKTIPLGIAIRRSIGKDKIFRVRRGNGYWDSIEGKIYQDQYAYIVPISINNIQSEPYRRQWIAAVHKWRFDLTAEQKAEYNRRADQGMHMSGYNLFMREAMKGLVQMFVDRGEPEDYDFIKTDLTLDNAWNSLNLSTIVPAGAKAILFRVLLTDDSTTSLFSMRKCGNSTTYNAEMRFTKHANVLRHCTFVVACNENREVDYRATATVWTTINIIVRGWWT